MHNWKALRPRVQSMLLAGKNMREIADALGVSHSSVKYYVSRSEKRGRPLAKPEPKKKGAPRNIPKVEVVPEVEPVLKTWGRSCLSCERPFAASSAFLRLCSYCRSGASSSVFTCTGGSGRRVVAGRAA